MEEKNSPPYRSCRMQNKPLLPPEATPGRCQKHNKTQTTESGTSGTTSDPLLEIDLPESFVPLSSELDITSTLANESDTIET